MELPPGCSGAHDADFYIDTLQQIIDAEIPFDAVCFKDASGTAVPAKVYETIRRARKMLPADAFIHFHTHETAGISVLANKAALDGGADAIDLSMAPCSGGTCQPDILVMWHALRGSEYDLDVDIDKVIEAEDVFKDCMSDYFLPPEATTVEPMIPWSPMPGGALTANTQMLRDNGIMDKYPAIIRAMSDVVRRGGYGTSVTPVSQFYFQQAFNNVMFGPWERIAEPYGKMVLGYFGKTPVSPDPEIARIASEQLGLEATTQPPLELNDKDPTKGLEQARKQLVENGLEVNDENAFIVATCKDKGLAFLKGEAEVGVRKNEPKSADSASPAQVGATRYTMTVDGQTFDLELDGDQATVNGTTFNVRMDVSDSKGQGNSAQPVAAKAAAPVNAQVPGVVLSVDTQAGDSVKEGDVVLVLEAMKMPVQVVAPAAGVIQAVHVEKGQQVAAGELLASIQ